MVFGFAQSLVSLPVSHVDLDTGISFLSGAVSLPNAAHTKVQLAGWEAALCICNAISEILNESSCQYVTLMSQSQMLDGFFFWPHCPLHKQKAFQRRNTPLGSCSGVQ